MGMFDAMQGALGKLPGMNQIGRQVGKIPGMKQVNNAMPGGGMPGVRGIGPSTKSQMMNKGQQGMRMGGGMGAGQQMPMPQIPQGNMPQKQFPQQQMPDLSQYAQQGQQAGNDMSWMQQPGAISPEYGGQQQPMQQQPMGPSPNGLQELLARMKMGNTGINGGGSPIEMNRMQMMNKRNLPMPPRATF